LEEGPVRRTTAILTAVAAAALVAGALAGCAPTGRGPGNQPAGCTPALPSGDASSIVKATGHFGKDPRASFPTPIVVKKSDEVTVLKAGRGLVATTGSQVDLDATIYDARSGQAILSTAYNGSLRAVAGKGLPGQVSLGKSSLATALVCAQTGSRIALTTNGKRLNAASGLSASASLVAVIDVVHVYPGKADGLNQLPQDGMPTVITAVDGQPGIVLQELDKPKTARSEVVKAGGGAVLKKGQTAVLHYTAWTWPDSNGDKPAVIDSLDTWSSGIAEDVALTTSDGVLPPKAIDAIVGQKVGSQLLVVLPPKDGYGKNPPAGATADDTVIFVIDVLGIRT
jgi:peptidylprolyl isomerase